MIFIFACGKQVKGSVNHVWASKAHTSDTAFHIFGLHWTAFFCFVFVLELPQEWLLFILSGDAISDRASCKWKLLPGQMRVRLFIKPRVGHLCPGPNLLAPWWLSVSWTTSSSYLRNGYNPSLTCQCNSLCPQYNNCCPDYDQLCAGAYTIELLMVIKYKLPIVKIIPPPSFTLDHLL